MRREQRSGLLAAAMIWLGAACALEPLESGTGLPQQPGPMDDGADAGGEVVTVALVTSTGCRSTSDCSAYRSCVRGTLWCDSAAGLCLGNNVDLACVARTGGATVADAGGMDAGSDAWTDVGVADAGRTDAGSADAGGQDIGTDTTPRDAGAGDTATADAGRPDAGADAGSDSGSSAMCGVVAGPAEQPASLRQCRFNHPPRAEFRALQPWLQAVLPPGRTSCTVRVSNSAVNFLDASGVVMSRHTYPAAAAWAGLWSRSPWFPLGDIHTPVTFDPRATTFSYTLRDADRVLHWGPARVAIPTGAVQYQFQATVESSTCPIQVGLDQYLSTSADPEWGVTMTELALGDWRVSDGCTQTLYTPRPDGACAAIATTTPPPTPPTPPPTRYLDRDGDGFGTGSPVAGGTATRGGDCDDTRSSVHPGATEVCDSRDNDCDGSTDEGGVCGPTSSRTDLWPSGAMPPLIALAASDQHVIVDGSADLGGRALSSWPDSELRASFWANGQSWNALAVSLTRFTVGGRVYFAVPVPTLPSGLTPFPHNQPSCRGARNWPARFNVHSRDYDHWMGIGPLATLGAVWTGLDNRGLKTSSLAVSRVSGRLRLSGAETSWGPCN